MKNNIKANKMQTAKKHLAKKLNGYEQTEKVSVETRGFVPRLDHGQARAFVSDRLPESLHHYSPDSRMQCRICADEEDPDYDESLYRVVLDHRYNC